MLRAFSSPCRRTSTRTPMAVADDFAGASRHIGVSEYTGLIQRVDVAEEDWVR